MDFVRTYTNLTLSQDNATNTSCGTDLALSARLGLCISGVFMICMSIVTVPANGLLFLTLVKDPLKDFRSRSSFFIMSLSFANFLVGLAVEPIYGFLYFVEGYRGESPAHANILLTLGQTFAACVNNTSFFTVCALAIDHYVAVSRPVDYQAVIRHAHKPVAFTIGVIWLYCIVFSLLPFMGVSEKIFFKFDLHVNSTLTLILLIAAYVAFAKSYAKRNETARRRERENSTLTRDRALLGVIFLLIMIASLTAIPTIIYWHVYDYCTECRTAESSLVFPRVLECFFYLKFVADPFVHAWRLRRYRQSLKLMFLCKTASTGQVTSF